VGIVVFEFLFVIVLFLVGFRLCLCDFGDFWVFWFELGGTVLVGLFV